MGLSSPIWYRRRRVGGGGAGTAAVPYWYDGLSVGNLDSSTNWQEMSGLATPHLAANAPYLWVNSDSPANMIACVNKTTAANTGVLTLTGQTAMIDLEDVESALVGGTAYLYGMDYGNNGNAANSRGTGIDMRIFRIVEPTITGSNQATTNFIEINCAFPVVNAPALRDCEASIIDENGKIWIITKRNAVQLVYSLDHAATYTGTQTLVYEGIMTALPASTTIALTTTPCYAVDACMSPNGKEIFVKNYNNIYYFPRLTGETVMQALQKSLVLVDGYVGGGSNTPAKSAPNAEPQGEGVAFDYDGSGYYTSSEYVATEGSSPTSYPLFFYKRCPSVPITVSFQDGVSPTAGYTGTTTTYIQGTTPTTDHSAETTYVVDITVGTPLDDRKGLLKFDFSSLSGVTVVGSNLTQFIEAEGQGWIAYRMLITWTGASTYTSLGGPINNDGVKAAVAQSWRNGINLDTIVNIAVKDNVPYTETQNMINSPSTNYGWLLVNLDAATGDGVQFSSKASVTPSRRPLFTIRYCV